MANLDSFIRKQRAARSEQVKSSEDPRNVADRGEAILNALIAEGYEITDDQYGEMLAQYMNTGRMSMPEPQAAVQEEAPVAPAAPTLPQEEAVQPRGLYDLLTQSTRTPVDALMGDGYFDALVDTAQSGVQNSVRAAVGRMAASENPLVKGAANVAGAAGDLAQGDLESYILRTGGAKDGTAQDMSELAAASKANREAATPAREALGSRGWLIRNLGEGTLDAASSPSSAASLIGGPVGAISIVDAYDQAYQQAADAGIDSKEDREMWALSQAAPELVSLLPASKVLQKLPVIGKVIDRAIKKPFTSLAARIVEREGSPALKALAKTVNSSLGEALEEGFTGGLQDVAAGVAANVEGPLQELGRNTASSTFGGRAENGTFGDTLFESARAGFIMGGGLSAPSNVTGAYADRANFIDEKSSETEDSILAGLERARPALPETSDTINVPPVSEQMQTFGMDEPNVDRELFNAEQDIQADETKTRSLEEAFSRREEEEALQQAVEEEAGFRTMELQNNAQGPMAEKLREAGVALEVTPEQVAQEVLVADAQKKREAGAEAKRQAELDAQAARVAEINRIAQRRKARGDTAAKKAADEKKKVQTKAAILRTKAVDQLMDEGMEDHQIVDALPARIKKLESDAATAEDKIVQKVEAARKSAETASKRKLDVAEGKRLANLVRANPNASASEIAEMFRAGQKATTTTSSTKAPRVAKDVDLEKLKASSDPMDRLQAEAIEGGLNQVGSKAKDADTPDYRKKVKKIARLLAGDSSDRAAAVEKLIKQGKIVIAPNEAAVGRKPAEGYVREGEHDTDTGVTYIYTDSMDGDSNPLPAIMEATSHETTHLAQFSPRDARSEQMRGLIGDWGVNSGAKIIRKAAAKGNKFAQEALRRAENDTRIRREAGESNPDRFEDLELVAYAVGHENKGRTNSLGSASGAVRDAVAGVKQTLRKKLGLNLDVSVGDLRSVMGKVLQEGVETEARGAKGEGSLDMILPARAAKAAPQDRLYVDPVDGETKFVISDADSAITANPDKIRNIAKGVPITTVMSHDVLYDQIPEIRDTRLEQLSGEEAKRLGAEAVAEENLIRINPTIVEEAALGIELGDRRGVGRLRETLLHETQHIVQSKGEGSTGGSPAMFFTPADLKKVQLHHKALRELADGAAALVLAADARVGDSLLDTAGDVANDVLSNPNKYDKHTVGLAEDFAASEGKANTMEKMVDAIWKKWDADYKQIQGEREAYWTELNRNKPLDELPINPTAVPFEQGGLPGTNDRASAVRRDAEGNMWLTPSRAARGTGESLNMVAKHGTPHTFAPEKGNGFGMFRDDKMGSGEGAQAFGWGHYLTEDHATADQQYRERLLRRGKNDNPIVNTINDYFDFIDADDTAYGRVKDSDFQEYIDDNRQAYTEIVNRQLAVAERQREALAGGKGYAKKELTQLLSRVNKVLDSPWLKSATRFDEDFTMLGDGQDIASALVPVRDAIDSLFDYLVDPYNSDPYAMVRELDSALSDAAPVVKEIVSEIESAYYNGEVDLQPEERAALADIDELTNNPEEFMPRGLGASLHDLTVPVTEDDLEASLQWADAAQRKIDEFNAAEQFVDNSTVQQIKKYMELPEEGNDGEVYYVATPDKSDLANWDGKLREQPASVRKAVADISNELEMNTPDVHSAFKEWYNRAHRAVRKAWYSVPNPADEINQEKVLSKLLHAAGVPGHFFQPPSRNKATSNFVVYDPSSLKIVGKDKRDKGVDRKFAEEQRKVAKDASDTAEARSQETAWDAAWRLAESLGITPGTIIKWPDGTTMEIGGDIVSRVDGRLPTEVFATTTLPDGDKNSDYVPVKALSNEMKDDGVKVYPGRKPNYFSGPVSLNSIAPSKSTRSFRNRNRFTTALVANLANSRGLGKAVRNEVELAKSAPVEFEEKANRAVGRYERGVNSQAAAMGMTPEALNNQIRDELEEAYATKGSPSEKKAAFHAVTAKYGEAGAALNELRGLVDDLSAGLVRTYLDQGGKLSPDVATDVSKIVSNLGGYVHRFYAARQGQGAGQMYRSAVEAAVAKAQNKGVDKLTKGEQKLVTRYNNAMKRILNDVIIPSEADMQEMSAPDLDYLYQVWFGPDQGLDRDGKIARLAELDVDTAAMRRQAERLAKEALHGVENSPINVRYSPGQKIDTTIMQKRTAIPKEIRELLGEITDPAGALLTTVSKQAEFLARTKLMLSLQEMASPNDLQPPTAGGSEYVRDNNMTVLSGEGFGPLNGWFASPSMRAMLDDTREHLQNFVDAATVNKDAHAGAFEAGLRGIGKLWMQGASKAKAANIIGNVFRYPLNFVGSFGMLGINGNMNVKTWGEGFADALRIIRYTANPAAGLGKAADVVKYGVVDSATVGDLKLLDSGKIERLVREMSGKNPRSLMRTARKVGMTVRETYAMMDVWSKIANFHAEVDYLTALYKDEGTPKTKDAIMREAADIVNFTNMTYSRTMPLIKSIERGGITQYGPYLYEAHRVLITNMLRGAYEVYNAKNFSSPKAKARAAAHGTKRMMGTMATLGAIKFATDALAALTFGDDEEDKRMALPEFARVMDFLPMGRNEDGKPILWGASALDPFGPATDLYRRARLGDDPFESIVEQFKENYIAPSLFGSLVDALAVTGGKQPVFRKTRNSIVKQWMPDGWTDPLMNRLSPGNIDRVNAWANLLETRYLPGTARAWNDNNPKAETGAGAAVWNIARGMGARGLLVDPAVGGQSAGFEYDDKLTNIRDGLKTVIRNTDNLTPERATSVVLELRAEEKEAWDKLRSTYNGMLALGLEEGEARAALVNGGVSKKVAKSVSNGEFQSQVINEQSIKQTADRAVAKKKTKAEQEKEQAKWDAAWEVLDAIEGGE